MYQTAKFFHASNSGRDGKRAGRETGTGGKEERERRLSQKPKNDMETTISIKKILRQGVMMLLWVIALFLIFSEGEDMSLAKLALGKMAGIGLAWLLLRLTAWKKA